VINPEPIIATLPLSLPEAPLGVTPVSTFVEPILDVRADFADSCQIGRQGDRWFLLIVDKTTEYVSLYNTKTRSNPLALLKEYLTFTGRKIRYLLMDNAKEFHSEEMLAFCRDNGIIIQSVIAYNHTGMCRVESYIGVVKSHGRVGMLNANVPLRFHGDAGFLYQTEFHMVFPKRSYWQHNRARSHATCIRQHTEKCLHPFRLTHYFAYPS
jgi:hypothetical protein